MFTNRKSLNIGVHLLVWLVLFGLPYILSYGLEVERTIAHFWIPMIFCAILFYFNYLILIDKLFFTKKTISFFTINILLIALFLFLKEYIETTFFENLFDKGNNIEGKKPPFKLFIYIQMLTYLAPLLFSIALKTTQKWRKTEAKSKEAANIQLQSELQHLHYQLQPHFFFNSLNNIYSLVDISPDQAKTSIHSLSKLMRYMLYETNMELVSLTKEIDFMTKYIALMKLRVTDKTEVSYNFPSENTTIQIAPLLFISLIENAFKHGVSASKESKIEINMTCKDKTIFISIENNNFPKKTDDKSGSGIGLQNLEKRLQLLYPNKYSFKTGVKDDRFLVTLEIETA
ncbi:GHKL domain-containing protein [Lutibacter oricola]|uniref:GHKL domain-containing protein n=1 Tax=Lutibacter oricola TaxID=762486 RepID=A0A1H2XFC9_9FLAO|nr:histidine kinase [Lutibacter oricola]SDW91418.1 GHKL domain-containing protein [Lutibacter oricola]